MAVNEKYVHDKEVEAKFEVENNNFKAANYGYRHQQCFILFLTLTTAYSMRACIGVALVAMTDSHYSDKIVPINNSIAGFNNENVSEVAEFNVTLDSIVDSNITEGVEFSTNYINATTTGSPDESQKGVLHMLLLIPPYPKFYWSKKIQDVVMSSFFWGYMLGQLPAGMLVHKFGPRRLLVSALSLNCIISITFPYAVFYGGWVVAAIGRMVQGLTQSSVLPAFYGFFGQWSPLEERSRLAGFTMSGQAIGTVLGLPITGFIAASPLGWPGIFRFFGLLSGLVALLVSFVIFDTPDLHPKISEQEKQHIKDGLGRKTGHQEKKMPIPWKDILKCRAMWAIIISHISQTWGQVTLFTEIPSFMDKVIGVNLKSNGLLTALPFFIMWLSNFFFNWLIDWIIVKKYMSVTHARKFANSLACFPAAAGLIILAYAPKNLVVIESILVFICFFKIAGHVGALVNHIDIAPNFAGTMMSISNFFSNLIGSQAPLAAGFLVTDVTSEHDWRRVFFVASGLYVVTNIAYLIMGTAEKAAWNDPPQSNPEDELESLPMLHKEEKKNGTNSDSKV